MSVFVDKVGNILGIMMDESDKKSLRKGKISIQEIVSGAVCHCSHIDTVKNAGKFDGRPGVLVTARMQGKKSK